MNILNFVGKVAYLQYINDRSGRYAQVIFVEKYHEAINYIPCIIPNRVLEDIEENLNLDTILEVFAHLDSKAIVKDDQLTLSQQFVVDKISYFGLNEDIVNPNVNQIGENFFNNKNIDDVPF